MTYASRCIVALVFVLDLFAPRPTSAIFVFDAGNFAQNLVSAIEAVDQTLTQIQQYQTQLRQYEEMVRNGAAPVVYTWDRIVSIQNKLRTMAASLRDYCHWLRDLDDYLKRFGDLDYYRSAQCYGSNLKCPEAVWNQILRDSADMHALGSESRKKTLDQLMHSLEASEGELKDESANLQKLQRQAQSADGQMKALQAGNQLASAEAQQLMQMRAIMVAQYRAIAVQAEWEQAQEAQQTAAGERFRDPMAKDSPKEQWGAWPKGQ